MKLQLKKRRKVMKAALHMELREHKSSFIVYMTLRILVILMMILQFFNIIRLNLSQNFCRKYKDQNRNFQCCRKLDLQIDLYKAWNNQQQQGENTQENIFIILIKKLQNHHQNDQNSECHIHDKRAFMLS